MVRNYVRKSERGTGYSPESFKIAIQRIKSGELTVYRASLIYGIPKNTLHDHIKGRRGKGSTSYGRRPAIGAEDEKSLANAICSMERWGFGLSRKEILKTVGDYVRINKIETPFKDGVPGEDWFLNFKSRHNLSIKIPQSVEFARKKNVDPFLIYDYFDLLEKTIKELGLEDKPSQIWNLDESSFCADPSKTKIVGQRGLPATRTTSGPGKQNTTVLMCCSAIGDKAPPLIIFKGKHVWDQWIAPSGSEFTNTTYAATSNGWMESEVFKNYFEKSFIPHIGNERPVLIIFDGHATHLGVDVIRIAIENQVTILKLPPHTSHILQPLDLSVFKSLKCKWDAKLVEWQRKNVGVKIPKSIFSKLIGNIWTETNQEILVNGFKKAGICPVDRLVVPEQSFDPNALKRWKEVKSRNNNRPDETNAETNTLIDDIPANVLNTNSVESNLPSTSVESNLSVSFEELLLKSVKRDSSSDIKKPKKRICLGAEVITQSDVAQHKENEKKKKEIKIAEKAERLVTKQKQKNKKKNIENLSDSDDSDSSWKSDQSEDRITEFDSVSESEINENIGIEDNVSYNDKEGSEVIAEEATGRDILTIQSGDFVLANFPGKKKLYKYVCLVKKVYNDEADVTGMRKLKSDREYRLDESDNCSIMLSAIEEKLQQPTIIKSAQFQKYVFEDPVHVVELK